LSTASGDGIFTVEMQCPNNISISEPDGFDPDQTQDISIYSGAYPRFNFTSFYTTTKACPAFESIVSDDIYDYHGSNVVLTSYYTSPSGIVEIYPYDSGEAVGALDGTINAAT
jgi:hypothetical protein